MQKYIKKPFIWADYKKEKNTSYIFSLSLFVKERKRVKIKISAYNFYKFYLNGELKFYGPARSPQGYCRIDEHSVMLEKGENILSAICVSYNVSNYSYVSDTPFFFFDAVINGINYNASDFKCYEFSEKIKNTQRYSFQRGFCEIYNQEYDLRTILLNIANLKKEIVFKHVTPLYTLKRVVPYFHVKRITEANPIQSGEIIIDDNKPVFTDRCIDGIGKDIDGYARNELCECITDTVSKFKYEKHKVKSLLNDKEYSVYDFKVNKTGFLGFDLEVLSDCEIYVLFDELLGDKVPVNFSRLSCCSVIKWKLRKGKYHIESIEPYTFRYCLIAVFNGAVTIKNCFNTLYENNEAYHLKFKIKDSKIAKIIEAAQNTVAQNDVDILMDCPSRERAGWINDIYFSRESVRCFTGNNKILKATLENYILAEQIKELPQGMIPMCYPSDHKNGEYIPNCAMWYIIILGEYLKQNKFVKYKDRIAGQINALLKYFEKYENEDGLLENLDSWIFIEWSIAGSKDYVAGVNYPSNMIYYKALKVVADLKNDKKLADKAEKIKHEIRKQSFNDKFFEDNRIRERGQLISLGHVSETCQYYAFSLGIASKDEYPDLYETLSKDFTYGEKRKRDYDIGKSNIIVGLLMRITVLLENGENEKVVDEIKNVYGNMANTTGTLWEHLESNASCNHGIAAYAGFILIKAITGFKDYKNGLLVFDDNFLNIDSEFIIPLNSKKYRIVIQNGKRSVYEIIGNNKEKSFIYNAKSFKHLKKSI